MEALNYKLDQFEGPLDLLLTLITKNKLNIDDIPISLLCDQYMEYINHSIENNIEVASEFLLMASELMLIKSRMLLPRKDEEEEDPRRALIDTVLEYQKAKMAAEELRTMFTEYGDRMAKEPEDLSDDKSYVAPHTVDLLVTALTRVLSETKITSETAKKSFEKIVHAPRIPIKTVVTGLIGRLRTNRHLYLDEYFRDSVNYGEMVAKFLCILELLKSHIITITEAPEDDESGVVNMASSVRITLNADADESRLEELDSLDLEDSPAKKDTVSNETFDGMKELDTY
ncbi:MAG: serine protease [Ruminococcaceae bacterium]|nr:serine protease [Oscillospiraceae bacterium]